MGKLFDRNEEVIAANKGYFVDMDNDNMKFAKQMYFLCYSRYLNDVLNICLFFDKNIICMWTN